MIKEGGYEGGGFAKYFGVQRLNLKAPDIVMSTIGEVTSKVAGPQFYEAGGTE